MYVCLYVGKHVDLYLPVLCVRSRRGSHCMQCHTPVNSSALVNRLQEPQATMCWMLRVSLQTW